VPESGSGSRSTGRCSVHLPSVFAHTSLSIPCCSHHSRSNLTLNRFGQIFGGLVAYGIDRGVKASGAAIAGWKIVFLVNGCLTATLGFIFLYVIPDNQLNARWLAPRDRVLAVARVRVNQQGIGNKHFKMYQLKEALLDPMTWAFVFYALTADIPNGGISNFFSQLVSI
jgi:MFS transporter, ACS family, allantoate permease